jgi:hypothetical protein
VPPADCTDCADWSASKGCRLCRLVRQRGLQTVQTGPPAGSADCADCADWSTSRVCRLCRLVRQPGLQTVQTDPPAGSAECADWSASGVCRVCRLVHQWGLQTVQTGPPAGSADCADWSTSGVCRLCRLVRQQGLQGVQTSPPAGLQSVQTGPLVRQQGLQTVQTGPPTGSADCADWSASRGCRVCRWHRLVHQQHIHIRLSKHFRYMIHALQSLYQCGRLPTYQSAGTCTQVAACTVGDSSHPNHKSGHLSMLDALGMHCRCCPGVADYLRTSLLVVKPRSQHVQWVIAAIQITSQVL